MRRFVALAAAAWCVLHLAGCGAAGRAFGRALGTVVFGIAAAAATEAPCDTFDTVHRRRPEPPGNRAYTCRSGDRTYTAFAFGFDDATLRCERVLAVPRGTCACRLR